MNIKMYPQPPHTADRRTNERTRTSLTEGKLVFYSFFYTPFELVFRG